MARQQGISEAQLTSFINTGKVSSTPQPVAPQAAPEQGGDLLDKTGRGLDKFFGGGALGKAVGTSLYGFSRLAQGDMEGFQSAVAQNKREFTPKVAAGDLIKMGSTLLSAAWSPAKGATVATRVGQAGIIGGGFGATNAVAESMKEDEQFDEILADARKGAVTGAVTGVVFQGAIEGMTAAGRKIMTSLLNTTKTVEKNTLRGKVPARKDVAGVLVDRKIAGTGESMLRDINTHMGKIDDDINTILAKTDDAGIVVKSNDVMSAALGKTLDDLDNNVSSSQLEKIFLDEKLPLKKLLEQENISLKDLNKVRSIIDQKYLGNNAWISQNPQPQRVVLLKNLTNVIRNMVKEQAPDTAPLFYDSRMLNVGRAMMIDKLASQPSMVRYLAESGLVAGGIAGAVAGGGIAFPAAMVGLIAGGRAASSPIVASNAGRTLSVIADVAQSLPQTFTLNQLVRAIYDNEQAANEQSGQEGQVPQSPTQ